MPHLSDCICRASPSYRLSLPRLTSPHVSSRGIWPSTVPPMTHVRAPGSLPIVSGLSGASATTVLIPMEMGKGGTSFPYAVDTSPRRSYVLSSAGRRSQKFVARRPVSRTVSGRARHSAADNGARPVVPVVVSGCRLTRNTTTAASTTSATTATSAPRTIARRTDAPMATLRSAAGTRSYHAECSRLRHDGRNDGVVRMLDEAGDYVRVGTFLVSV